MSQLIRRSRLVKVFAFVTLLAVSGLSAQYVSVWEPTECEALCHETATDIYNAAKDNDLSESAALGLSNAVFQHCMQNAAALCG